MRKLFLVLSALATMLSCSNEQVLNSVQSQKEIEVVYLNASKNVSTRSSASSTQVLKFRDEAVYKQTLAKLQTMSTLETVAFFKELGFDGAYTHLKNADNELDSIFDIENEKEFLDAVEQYKQKYSDYFVFNDNDIYDLSPYLPYSDTELRLVGNIDGHVVIGNSIVSPSNFNPDYMTEDTDAAMGTTRATALGPIEPKFQEYSTSGFMIKKGKYQSSIKLGVDRNSGFLMIRFASQKKKALWKRRHETNYTVDLSVGDFHITKYHQPNEKKGVIVKFIPPLTNVNRFNGVTNCSYRNFTSGACSDVFGNYDFQIKF